MSCYDRVWCSVWSTHHHLTVLNIIVPGMNTRSCQNKWQKHLKIRLSCATDTENVTCTHMQCISKNFKKKLVSTLLKKILQMVHNVQNRSRITPKCSYFAWWKVNDLTDRVKWRKLQLTDGEPRCMACRQEKSRGCQVIGNTEFCSNCNDYLRPKASYIFDEIQAAVSFNWTDEYIKTRWFLHLSTSFQLIVSPEMMSRSLNPLSWKHWIH